MELAAQGWRATAIAGYTGIPRTTVRDWIAGRIPRAGRASPHSSPLDAGALPKTYPYLLGLYLGDGHISPGPRGVYRLRIFLDAKYPGIVAQCRSAIEACVPNNRVSTLGRRSACTGRPEPTTTIVYAYSKVWPALFPQHGPGRKHERRIVLSEWQRDLIDASPHLLIRGLIHSDGCRAMNTGRKWRHPRYSFSNKSSDIRGIFEAACARVGLHTTRSRHTVYVSRIADVATLDSFVGPKR